MEHTIDEIAVLEGLRLIKTTSSITGYPVDTKMALIGFNDMDELESYARQYDLTKEIFTKNYNQDLWVRTNVSPVEEFDDNELSYGEGDFKSYSKMSEGGFMLKEMTQVNDYLNSMDDFEYFYKIKKEIWDAIVNMKHNELVITKDGKYFETIPSKTMHKHLMKAEKVIGLYKKY